MLLLPFQQPAKLLGALRDRHCQGLHAPRCEQRDHLGPKNRGVLAIGRVEHDHRLDGGTVGECVVERRHSGRIMSNRDDLPQGQTLDDRFQAIGNQTEKDRQIGMLSQSTERLLGAVGR